MVWATCLATLKVPRVLTFNVKSIISIVMVPEDLPPALAV
jgi:hypothetical protein